MDASESSQHQQEEKILNPFIFPSESSIRLWLCLIALFSGYLLFIGLLVYHIPSFVKGFWEVLEFLVNKLLSIATGKNITWREFSWRMIRWYGYLVLLFGGLSLLGALPNVLKFSARWLLLPVNLLLAPIFDYFRGHEELIEKYEMEPLYNWEIEEIVDELCESRWLQLDVHPTLWISFLPLPSPAMAFGSHRESHLCLSSQLLEEHSPSSKEFKAVVLHELAHIKSGDIALINFLTSLLHNYYALCSLLTFLLVVASIVSWSFSGKAFVMFIQLFIFGLIGDLLIRSARRHREKAADIRSALCLGEWAATWNALSTVDAQEADDALTMDVLFSMQMQFSENQDASVADSKKWGIRDRLWSNHPPIPERLATLQNINEKAFQTNSWTVFLVGFVSTFLLSSALVYLINAFGLQFRTESPPGFLESTFPFINGVLITLFGLYFLLNSLRPAFLLPKNVFISTLKSLILFELGGFGGMVLYLIPLSALGVSLEVIKNVLTSWNPAFLLIALALVFIYSAVCRYAIKAFPDVSLFQRQLKKSMRMLILWLPLLTLFLCLAPPLQKLAPIVWIVLAIIYLITLRRRVGVCPHCHEQYQISSVAIQWSDLSHTCSNCGQDIYHQWYHINPSVIHSPAPSSVDIEPSVDVEPQLRTAKPAGFFRRAGALVFDLLFLDLLLFAFLAAIYPLCWAKAYSLYASLLFLIYIICPGSLGHWVYFMIWNSWRRQTIGKKLMGIRTQRTDGTALTKKRSLLRYFAYFLALIPFGLGFLWSLWDKRKQGWHDKLVNSQVVQVKPVRPVWRYLAVVGLFVVHFVITSTLYTLIDIQGTSSASMAPTIPEGRFVLIDKAYAFLNQLERGDVVRISNNKGSHWVRVVGLPGDTIEIREGRFYINGEVESSLYDVSSDLSLLLFMRDHFQVPAERYFVIGDDRSYCYLNNILGFVTKNQIGGKALFSINPFVILTK